MDLSFQMALTGISTFAAATLAVITLFSMRASRAMAREMYESRIANFRPLLYPILKIYKRDNGASLGIRLRNVGPGAAMDVDIICRGRDNCREHIAFLGPGEKVDISLRDRRCGIDRAEDVQVKVSYRDIFNNPLVIKTTYSVEPDESGSEQLVYPIDTQLDGHITCSGQRL